MGGSGTDGSDQLNPCKPRYDISMSKRTRRPRMRLNEAFAENDAKRGLAEKGGALEDAPDHKGPDQPAGEDDNDHMSWEELVASITGSKEEHTKEVKEPAGGQETSDDHDHGQSERSSLGQHFTEEEKQLRLVMTKQKQELVQGLKFKGIMGHYVKVFSLFMKAKQVEPVYKTGNINRPKKKKPPILW